MNRNLLTLTSALILSLVASSAQAAILSVSQGGKIIPPPNDVGDNGFSDSHFMLGFDEKQNVLLSQPLQVDNGFIASGKRVNSHMIFLNQPNDSFKFFILRDINWTFAGTILGVMSDNPSSLEAASSSLLGSPNTTYPSLHWGRGLEGDPYDKYSGVGTNNLKVTMAVTQPGDWIRVITEAKSVEATSVPEPTSVLGLLTVGVLGSTAALKRNKKLKA